jgi:aspartate/methionine/tyrosine aminotransferase
MVRGAVEGGYNLAIGEPVLLQQKLVFPEFKFQGVLDYPTMFGIRELVHELEIMHPGYEIVITNGGKQALTCAFIAMARVMKKTCVWHQPPFWPSYPTMANYAGLNFNDHDGFPPGTMEIHCMTSPNNPDGRQGDYYGMECDVWDAVYAHWVYGWDGVAPKHKIRIGSASKLLGLSGARVGWMLTKDMRLAEEARHHIEFTTSGVSQIGQKMVAHALRSMREGNPTPQLMDVRHALLQNGEDLVQILGPYMKAVEGLPDHGRGMFAWIQPKNPVAFQKASAQARVSLVSGEACGSWKAGYWRVNMMQDRDITKAALTAIKTELDRW